MCRGPSRGLQCNAPWNPHPSVPADRKQGRLQRRIKCRLEKSTMLSRLTDIAKQHNPP